MQRQRIDLERRDIVKPPAEAAGAERAGMANVFNSPEGKQPTVGGPVRPSGRPGILLCVWSEVRKAAKKLQKQRK